MASDESAFEYEDEAVDEAAFEMADESADEMADESADEMADESADEAAFELADESADESVDESADESADEAVDSGSLAERLRASQARASFARRVEASQRIDKQRAEATRRYLENRLRSISGSGPRMYSLGRLRGARKIRAQLANGRVAEMAVYPPLAAVSEVNQLRAVLAANEKRQAQATAANAQAIKTMVVTQATVTKRLTDENLKSERALGKQIVDVNARLDKRITKELTGQKAALDQYGKRIMRRLKHERSLNRYKQLAVAGSAVIAGAYGDRTNLFARDNLIIFGSTVGALLLPDIVEQYARSTGRRRSAMVASRASTTVAAAGAGANVALLYFLLHKRNHLEVVSGFAQVTGSAPTTVQVTIPTKSAADFKAANHAVAATISAGTIPIGSPPSGAVLVRASVTGEGKLTVAVDNNPTGNLLTVQWFLAMQPETKASVVAA